MWKVYRWMDKWKDRQQRTFSEKFTWSFGSSEFIWSPAFNCNWISLYFFLQRWIEKSENSLTYLALLALKYFINCSSMNCSLDSKISVRLAPSVFTLSLISGSSSCLIMWFRTPLHSSKHLTAYARVFNWDLVLVWPMQQRNH